MTMNRRHFLAAGAAGAAVLGFSGCASIGGAAKARVVVIGGGYGGATAAKYIRMLDRSIDVVLVEPNEAFVSCPISNLVLGGYKTMADITTPYAGLERNHGVKLVRDMATAIDMDKKQVRLAKGDPLSFDRLIVAPGIDFMYEGMPGLNNSAAQAAIMHAWKAGPQTAQLRKQLEAMPDGGVFVMSMPEAPYRCPPGPYERVCQIASYFKQAKPRSKVLLLDANPDVTSKGPLFKKAWTELYGGIIEYRPNSKAIDVDIKGSVRGAGRSGD